MLFKVANYLAEVGVYTGFWPGDKNKMLVDPATLSIYFIKLLGIRRNTFTRNKLKNRRMRMLTVIGTDHFLTSGIVLKNTKK